MSKVSILSPELISKIAAGEVIERPASAVKELIENALDAEAQSIEFHIKESGKTLIHIKDTGTGIAKDDIEKIFTRHATSKIKSLDDLDAIRSLGFRGEALYSIAAIAHVTLRSKTKDQDTGWEIYLHGGKRVHFKPAAMNNGTELEVQELFFNTPARRKFLKSDTTEFTQILNIIIPYALLHHGRRFLLTHQGKTILDLKPASSAKARMAQALNLDEEHLIETHLERAQDGIKAQAILGDINVKRSQKDMQFIFVNGRPVQNRSLAFHLNQVYQLILMPHAHPVFAVAIDVPAENVDVNVHPTKREIKIKNEHQLATALRQMCEAALMASSAKQAALASPAPQEQTVSNAFTGAELNFETPVTEESLQAAAPFYEPYAFPAAPPAQTQAILFESPEGGLHAKLAQARFIGSAMNKFLLFESGRSLLVVDQHAAQERIAFERFMRQMQSGQVEVQQLLSPILIKLSPQEINAFEDVKGKLDEIGLVSTMFDDQTLALHAYPILLKNPEPAVRYLLSGENISHCDHETIARRACRSSVMAGDYLNKEKAEYQKSELMKCRDPFTCPHGRPTVVEMPEKFLDKQFLRT